LIGALPPSASAGRARVGQQRHLTRVLDRGGDVALVLRAVAGNPPGPDLAAVGDELPQQPRVLVVHVSDLFLAEQANLLLWLANRRFCHRCASWQSPASGGDGRIGFGSGGGTAGSEGRLVREALFP